MQQGATLIAISVDSPQKSKELVAKLGLTFPVYQDVDGKLVIAYGIKNPDRPIAKPSSFVITPDGKVVYAHVGQSPTDRPALAVLRLAIPAE